MLTRLRYLPSSVRGLVMSSADVPHDLSSVTSIDASAEVDPESVGISRRGANAIWNSVESIYATGMQPGMSFVLRRHGEIILKRAIGHARGAGPGDRDETPVPMTPDTPVCLYSASKAIAAMLVHMLSERKEISLLDPISHYVPAFGQNGKRDITIYQLLCHKAGIPTVDAGPADVVELLLDKKEILRRLYASAPEKPGHHHAYHALTAGFVIADLVETVAGQTFRSFFQDHIAQPLGLASMDFGAKPAVVKQLARNYTTGVRVSGPVNLYLRRAIGTTLERAVDVSNDPRFYQAVIPAGNGVANADDSSRFFQCLLDGGVLDGVRVFDPLTVRRATAEVGKPEVDRSLLVPLRYSAGMMLGDSPWGLYGPDTTRAFGHLGFTNNFVWADPDRDISVALLTTGKLVAGLHLPYLLGLLRNISRHCPKLSEVEITRRELAGGLS